MNIGQININLENLILNFNPESFIYDLLLAYGTPKATIARAQLKEKKLLDEFGDDVIIRKKVFYRVVQPEELLTAFNELRANDKVRRHEPRFIVVTDLETLLAVDTKTIEVLDVPLIDINRHFDFFLPWAGMEKHKIVQEQEADLEAADRMAKLYDEICKTNPTETPEQVHNLNVFLSRLLFCFFAEDTDIFEKNLFTNSIDSHTQTDGSDVNSYLDTLFEVMNTDYKDRNRELPEYLKVFPYVNGGLFRNTHAAPVFTQRSRRMLIVAGSLQWRDINPDIFGSMIQAVVTPEHRGGLGMHYTSVPNIMKVIEPLFLNELQDEYQAAKGNKKKLEELLKRIWKIKIFDPACGSGNFLIIAYKKLRELEMDIFNELGTFAFSEINLDSFYGIELDDFAHEVATLSLWLAEHQMNQVFKARFGDVKPALPLKQTGNIVHGNACRVEWETVCPKTEGDEVYILGNPPYLGYSLQNESQKEDMAYVFRNKESFKTLDYISCWFFLGASYIQSTDNQFAFVSTNSICQGEQVAALWPNIFDRKLEIGFAYTSFKWTNSAKSNAGVIVAIIGVRNRKNISKYIYTDVNRLTVRKISPYLIDADDFIVYKRNSPLSKIPQILRGSSPVDGGHLILNREEFDCLIKNYPDAIKFTKMILGSQEFINGNQRWCLWITDNNLYEALQIPFISNRINKVKEFRLLSKKAGTIKDAHKPHLFSENRFIPACSIFIPRVSSERRDYIPMGFLNENIVILDSGSSIYEAQPWLFSILTSKIHMAWIQTVGGRLKSDYRYSAQLCYNTFPFPSISDKQKQELEKHTYNIISERERHSEKTLAELYDPDKMPDGLREAHRLNDLAVERCYRSRPFESDEERLEYLFKLYEQMIAEEKQRGTLFEEEKKSKKKK